MIFSDGFESGNFSAWTSSGGSYLTVTTGPHDGVYGAYSQVDGFCSKTLAAPCPHIRLAFWFALRGTWSWAAGDKWTIARICRSDGTMLAEVFAQLTTPGGPNNPAAFKFGVRYRDDAGATATVLGAMDPEAVDGVTWEWHFFQLDLHVASSAGADNGRALLAYDGDVINDVAGIDNDTLVPQRVECRLAPIGSVQSIFYCFWDTVEVSQLAAGARGFRIFHNSGVGPVDYGVVRASRNETGLSWTSPALAVPATWRFGVRAFNEYGEEKNLDVAATLSLEASGAASPLRPNRPVDLAARPTSGGCVEVSFGYDGTDEPAACTHFHVYADDGSGAINYASPLGAVARDDAGPLSRGVFLTGPLDGGVPRHFAVRAATAADVEDDGTEWVPATPDAIAPAQPASLTAGIVR